jgi:hypothetical protein
MLGVGGVRLGCQDAEALVELRSILDATKVNGDPMGAPEAAQPELRLI